MEHFENQLIQLTAELEAFRTKQKKTRENWNKNSKKYYNNKFKTNTNEQEVKDRMEQRRQYQREYYKKNKQKVCDKAKAKYHQGKESSESEESEEIVE